MARAAKKPAPNKTGDPQDIRTTMDNAQFAAKLVKDFARWDHVVRPESYWRSQFERFTADQCELLERVFYKYPNCEQPLSPIERARLAGIVPGLSSDVKGFTFDPQRLCFFDTQEKRRYHRSRSTAYSYRTIELIDEGSARRFLEQVFSFNEVTLAVGVSVHPSSTANPSPPKDKSRKAWLMSGTPPDGWHQTPLLGQMNQFAEWLGTTEKPLRSKKYQGVTHRIIEHIGCDPETKWPAPFAIYFPWREKFTTVNGVRRIAADKYLKEQEAKRLEQEQAAKKNGAAKGAKGR